MHYVIKLASGDSVAVAAIARAADFVIRVAAVDSVLRDRTGES